LGHNNISGVTDHPHSSRISWIDSKHQSIDLRYADDVADHDSQCEEDTALKANWAPDELRRCGSVDARNVSVTEYLTSHCTDSNTSLTKLSAILSRKEYRALNSEIHGYISMIRDRERELIDTANNDSGCDAEGNVTQLKLPKTPQILHVHRQFRCITSS